MQRRDVEQQHLAIAVVVVMLIREFLISQVRCIKKLIVRTLDWLEDVGVRFQLVIAVASEAKHQQLCVCHYPCPAPLVVESHLLSGSIDGLDECQRTHEIKVQAHLLVRHVLPHDVHEGLFDQWRWFAHAW